MRKNSCHLKKRKSEDEIHVEMKYLNNTQKNKIQNVKNSILELEKDTKQLKDRKTKIRKYLKELKDKKMKINKALEDLSTKASMPIPRPRKLERSPNSISSADMDKFEKVEIIKKRLLAKNTWHDWLIDHISKPYKRQ